MYVIFTPLVVVDVFSCLSSNCVRSFELYPFFFSLLERCCLPPAYLFSSPLPRLPISVPLIHAFHFCCVSFFCRSPFLFHFYVTWFPQLPFRIEHTPSNLEGCRSFLLLFSLVVLHLLILCCFLASHLPTTTCLLPTTYKFAPFPRPHIRFQQLDQIPQ